ncbi:Diaminopimelate epimerase [Paenibacillus sp. CECT 9249]|nr:Diaminopimelate epimerase [Paenibacillus sp. CECT 9249]
MKYTKMHGLGNSYIYINGFEEALDEGSLSPLAMRVSNVNTGIGSDGMIVIGPSEVADFRMRIFNIDGSEGKNCGNGLRCVAKYVFERKMTERTRFTIETLGGNVEVKIDADDACRVRQVTVDMGAPRLLKGDLPMLGDPEQPAIDEAIAVNGRQYRITAVSMGNPHAVLFVPDAEAAPVAEIGPQIEHAPLFPERTNVEFIQVVNRREIIFRVWERGSGITQACGTGACAAVVAGVLNGELDRGKPVTVHLLGGDLEIIWENDGRVFMKGPAEIVTDGELYL